MAAGRKARPKGRFGAADIGLEDHEKQYEIGNYFSLDTLRSSPPVYLQTDMPSADRIPKTLYDKVFDHHIVDEREDGTILLYIGKIPLRVCFYRTPLTQRSRQTPCP